MKSVEGIDRQKSFLMPGLAEQLDPRQPIRKLADHLPWEVLEEEFGAYYSEEGRPAKAIRLMVGLLLLKQMYNFGDETVVAAWVQNPYWQYFCGMKEFQWEVPCDPSDLVYFRRRIGEDGVALIFSLTARMHGKKCQEQEIVVDTTVQEKQVSFPTDSKLHRKVIVRCWKLADRNGIRLRRRYLKEVRRCVQLQRWRRDPRKRKLAYKGARRLRTIAGILLRELERKLPAKEKENQKENFVLYRRVLNQKRYDKNKVYALHEPHIYCIAKGKDHKKYEFGTKASVAMTKQSCIIVGAVAHLENLYDGDALPEALEMAEAVVGNAPGIAIADRGYRGRKLLGQTQVLTPQRPPATQSKYRSQQMRKRFRRRSAIEPVIGHLKSQYRLMRCYLKGFLGDQINLMLAASAWNLRKWMRDSLSFCLFFLHLFTQPFNSPVNLHAS